MSDGGAQFCHMFLGAENAGFKIDFKAAGTSVDKQVWTDEGRSNPVFKIQADNNGMAIWYADGDYRMVITTNSGGELYDLKNVKMTSDTATMWEGNFGVSLPIATEKNRNQLFALIDSSNAFKALYINTGNPPAFTAVAGEQATRSLTDLVGATGYTPSIQQIQFDATDIDIVRDFNVPTDGSDASVPLQNALNAWRDLSTPGTLRFPARKQINIDLPVDLQWTVNDGRPKFIDGNGCRIMNGLSSGDCLKFRITGSALTLNNLTLRDLHMITSSNTNTSSCLVISSDGGAYNKGTYLDNVVINGFGNGKGIVIDDAFELAMNRCQARGPQGGSGYNLGIGIEIKSTSGNSSLAPSSITLMHCITDGGLYGLDAKRGSDTRIYGITCLNSYSYGMRLGYDIGFGGGIFGAHIENNYRQAGSLAAGAGIRIISGSGSIALSNVVGSSITTGGATYYQKYVVDVNTVGTDTNIIAIMGGRQKTIHADGNTYFGNFGGNANVIVIGQTKSQVYDGAAEVQQINGWTYQGIYNTRRAQSRGSGLSGNLAVELDNGNYHIVTSINGDLTINAPTSGFYGSLIPNGTKLAFIVRQDGTGGRALNFNAIYKNVASWTGGTSNYYALYEFEYYGGVWVKTMEQINVNLV